MSQVGQDMWPLVHLESLQVCLQVYSGEQGLLSLAGPAYRLLLTEAGSAGARKINRRCLHRPSAMQSVARGRLTE